MWTNVDQFGAMWSNVERCGTHNRDVERCGAMWDGHYNMYILAIRYDRIRPKISFSGNNAGAPMPRTTHWSFVSRTLHSIISLFHQTCRCTTIPHCLCLLPSCSFFGDTRLSGASLLPSLSLSSSRRGCNVCALPFWSGLMFYYLPIVAYILRCHAMSCDVNVTSPISCDVVQCGTMWRNVARCGAMWRNVAQCGAMWRNVARCGVMWRDVARCGAMWHDVARCGAMWRNVARCDAM
jgi:hypothetical protein